MSSNSYLDNDVERMGDRNPLFNANRQSLYTHSKQMDAGERNMVSGDASDKAEMQDRNNEIDDEIDGIAPSPTHAADSDQIQDITHRRGAFFGGK